MDCSERECADFGIIQPYQVERVTTSKPEGTDFLSSRENKLDNLIASYVIECVVVDQA